MIRYRDMLSRKFKRISVRNRTISLPVVAILHAVLYLPVMSAYVISDKYSGIVLFRGCDLIDFSWWGAIPLVAPLLLVTIFILAARIKVRVSLIIILGAGVSFGTHLAFLRAYDWLRVTATQIVDINFGCGLPLYATVFFAVALLCVAADEKRY